jgi:replicative DNA helicase
MASFAQLHDETGLPGDTYTERTILGAMLLEPMAVNDATEKLTPDDFSLDSHRRVYAAILDLIQLNHAIDLVTVRDTLKRKRELDSVGGEGWLFGLTEGIPFKLNIEDYVRIVKDKSLLRQMMGIFTDGAVRAGDQREDAITVLSDVEARLAEVADKSIQRGFSGISDIVRDSFGSIDKLYEQGREITGLATHYDAFDRMTSGLQQSELIIIAARPSMGKAQPLTAKILTPSGFIAMGEVVCGTKVIGSDGKPCEVTGVFPQGTMPIYNVLFSDGTSTQCTHDHLWWTQTRNERRRGIAGSVKTLAEIEKTLHRVDGGKQNHVIPLVEAVEYEGMAQLPVHPYVLGVLLGDGCLSEGHGKNAVFANPEQDILERVQQELDPLDEAVKLKDSVTCLIRRKQRNNEVSEVSETAKRLEEMGVMGALSYEKAIPAHYLRASVEARRQLLAGLLDTDGHVNKTGRTMEYSTSSPILAGQVAELARGLGLRVSLRARIPTYTYRSERLQGRKSYRVRIYSGEHNPTRSAKHAAAWNKVPSRQTHRAITAVTPAGEAECQCIRVSAPDSLYVTDDFILTHNTAWAINIAQNAAVRDGKVVAVFSLEMSKESLLRRMLASEAMVNSRKIQTGFLPREDKGKLMDGLERLIESKLFVDDTPGITLAEMRAKSRRLMQQEKRLDLIVIDYLQLMTGSAGANQKKFENRTQEVSSVSRGLKALAKELKVPVVALSQLSRGSEQRTGDKKPLLSDLRESGSIEQDADVVCFIHREEYYDRENEDLKGKAEIIIAKQRNGPTGSVQLAYLADYTRFENLDIAHDPNHGD